MKKYSSYKDSGYESIGDIPNHWITILFKRVIQLIKDGTHGSFSRVSDGYPFLSAKNVFNEGLKISDNESQISYESYIEITKNGFPKKNDLLITCVGTIGRTMVYDRDEPMAFQRSVSFLRLDKEIAYPKFYKYYVESNIYQQELQNLAKTSAQSGVYMKDISNSQTLLPPIKEQTQIANYLDKKTAEIDDLIAKKERFIELLEEEKIAFINQAVTKGLNPNVPMKDSGIDWLGEIPEHWNLYRMRYLCDIGTGDKDTENKEENGCYPFYVRSQNIERISTYTYEGEAILTAGDGVGVCKVWHYVNEKFDYHQRVYRLSGFKEVIGKYLYYFLKENFEKEVKKLSAKSTVDSLRRPMFQNFQVSFGSIEEQYSIVLSIESNEKKINKIIKRTKEEIELLKEYRTTLISDVVTGKIDVRDYNLN